MLNAWRPSFRGLMFRGLMFRGLMFRGLGLPASLLLTTQLTLMNVGCASSESREWAQNSPAIEPEENADSRSLAITQRSAADASKSDEEEKSESDGAELN